MNREAANVEPNEAALRESTVVAIPTFRGVVAPRFCFADVVLLARVGCREVSELSLRGLPWPERLQALSREHVTLLLCGGFNRRLLPFAESVGIEVIWGLSGDVAPLVVCIAEAHHVAQIESFVVPRLVVGCVTRRGCRSMTMSQKPNKTVVAFAVRGPSSGLDTAVDPRFGRAERFLVVDLWAEKVIAEQDNGAVNQPGGAGPMASSAVANLGASIVVSGRFGPKAVDALDALGVSHIETDAQTVRDALGEIK